MSSFGAILFPCTSQGSVQGVAERHTGHAVNAALGRQSHISIMQQNSNELRQRINGAMAHTMREGCHPSPPRKLPKSHSQLWPYSSLI